MKRKMKIAVAGVIVVGALATAAAPASAVHGDWDRDGTDPLIVTSLELEVEVDARSPNNLRQLGLAL